MYKSFITLFTCFAILAFHQVFASTEMPAAASGSINGIVIDSISKQGMQYTNVVLKSAQDSNIVSGTITDEKGAFALEQIPFGSYYLEINFIGYQKKTIEKLELNKENRVLALGEQILQPAMNNLKSVDIVAERNYVTYEVDKRVVNVSKNLTAQGGSAAEALEDVPSVRVDAEGNISLRGSNSFIVLVDGRPTPVDGQTLLKSLPASAIENIEIITNPSAKYDPDGTTGILNVIMKKEKITGFNGLVNAAANSIGGYGVTANMNYRTKKVNYHINGSFNHSSRTMKSRNDRETYFSDTTAYLHERTDRKQINVPHRLNAGADFYLNDKNFLTVSGVIGGFGFDREFDTRYEYYTEQSPHVYSLSDNQYDVNGVYYGGGLSYEHKFSKDHKLELGGGAWIWNGDDKQLSQQYGSNANFEQISDQSKLKSHHDNLRKNLRLKADYTAPLFKGKLEAGVQSLITTGTSEYTYHNFDLANDNWVYDSTYSNTMQFDRNLLSAYATYTNKWKKFSYMLGMRLEYMDRVLDQKTLGLRYPVELYNYYPSLHISRMLDEKKQIQLSYSRRINRPQPWELNPFLDYSDEYNRSHGNPELKPEDIDSYELNYIQQLKKATFSGGGYYRQTNNTKVMAQSISPESPEVMLMTYYNLDKTYAYGGEVSYRMYVNKWFNYTVNLNAYHYHVSANIAKISSTQTSNNLDASAKLSFKLKKIGQAEFTAIYNSPGADGQGRRKENYYANFALKKSFLQNRANLVFNIQDVFATSRYRTVVDYEQFHSYFELKNKAPVFRLSFSYRINNYKHQTDKTGIGGR